MVWLFVPKCHVSSCTVNDDEMMLMMMMMMMMMMTLNNVLHIVYCYIVQILYCYGVRLDLMLNLKK